MIAPILKGKRVVLKPRQVKHAPSMLKWFLDPVVLRYQKFDNNLTLKKLKSHIIKRNEEKNRCYWMIYTRQGELIGVNALTDINDSKKSASWNITIGEKEYWNQGYGTDTLKTVSKFFFDKLKYNRLELTAFPKNIAGIKCYKKCGFKKEGIKRKAICKNGKFHDLVVMSLIKNDYKKFKK
jgi:RimJ/RimL family protein N-acetyltransferase